MNDHYAFMYRRRLNVEHAIASAQAAAAVKAAEESDALFERMKAGLVRTVDAEGRVWWTKPK